MNEQERLRGEYNAAVANGLIIKARLIGRRIDRLIATECQACSHSSAEHGGPTCSCAAYIAPDEST